MGFSFILPQAALGFPHAHNGVCLRDQPVRIAGVNVLLAPARIVISTPWAIRPGQVLLKTLQASA